MPVSPVHGAFCENCGGALGSTDIFCPECGAKGPQGGAASNTGRQRMWDDFCSTHQVGALGKPIFETGGDKLTVQTYDKNKRTILALSEAIRAVFKQEIDLLKRDFDNKTDEYDGLIYILYLPQDNGVLPLYIGIAEKIGKSGKLSSTLKGDKSVSRWGDADTQYHIGGLSTVVCTGYSEDAIYKPKKPWADRLFHEYPASSPRLKEPTCLFVKAWRGADTGCWKDFGATPLPFLESCLIALASSLFPDTLLNVQGVSRAEA
jgi:hypothetical protein